MTKLSPTGTAAPVGDEFTLKRETERITVYDRRSGAKLHTRDITGPDVCPSYADIKMSGDKAGLRSPVLPPSRDAFFKELRGEAPPAAPSSSSQPSTAQPSNQKPQKPGKK